MILGIFQFLRMNKLFWKTSCRGASSGGHESEPKIQNIFIRPKRLKIAVGAAKRLNGSGIRCYEAKLQQLVEIVTWTVSISSRYGVYGLDIFAKRITLVALL